MKLMPRFQPLLPFALCAAVLSPTLVAPACAGPITTLFGTGVDGGINTLQFNVVNTGGHTGLSVGFTGATANNLAQSTVTEPQSLALSGIALLALGATGMARRRPG